MCQKGARVVQEQVLDVVDSDDVRVYAIWEPILRNDDHSAAQQAPRFMPDPRVTHYWVDSRDVGALFQKPIQLKSEPAWDVYLIYAPGVVWGESVPTPEYFQHQLSGRLPKNQRLDGTVLAEKIRAVLAEAHAH